MQEENYEQQEDYRFDTVYSGVLNFVKTLIVYSVLALFIATASFWFMYEVEGKPLSTHTSELSIKLVKQLAEDGYLAGMKVMFTEKEYCINNTGAHKGGDNCITEKDRESLDRLIDRALFVGGPNGISKK